jgi:hypothetical protein
LPDKISVKDRQRLSYQLAFAFQITTAPGQKKMAAMAQAIAATDTGVCDSFCETAYETALFAKTSASKPTLATDQVKPLLAATNLAFAFVPILRTVPIQTTTIKASITAYSTAVGPSSETKKSLTLRMTLSIETLSWMVRLPIDV